MLQYTGPTSLLHIRLQQLAVQRGAVNEEGEVGKVSKSEVTFRLPLSQPTQRPDMGARIRTPGHLDNPPDFWSPKHLSLETFSHLNIGAWRLLVTKMLHIGNFWSPKAFEEHLLFE